MRLRANNQMAGVEVIQRADDLRCIEGRVEGVEDGAELEDGVGCNGEFEVVAEGDGDAVTFLYSNAL